MSYNTFIKSKPISSDCCSIMNSKKRMNIKQILSNPEQKRELMVGAIQFLQNIEGINTTREKAENAYDKVQSEKLN